jgi:hypothetical protein
MARSKTDQYLTPLEREALTYLTNLKLKGCFSCLKVRRADMFGDDGQCIWCREEDTPEINARVEGDKALLKRLRAKLKRINSKKRPAVTWLKPKPIEDDE